MDCESAGRRSTEAEARRQQSHHTTEEMETVHAGQQVDE